MSGMKSGGLLWISLLISSAITYLICSIYNSLINVRKEGVYKMESTPFGVILCSSVLPVSLVSISGKHKGEIIARYPEALCRHILTSVINILLNFTLHLQTHPLHLQVYHLRVQRRKTEAPQYPMHSTNPSLELQGCFYNLSRCLKMNSSLLKEKLVITADSNGTVSFSSLLLKHAESTVTLIEMEVRT